MPLEDVKDMTWAEFQLRSFQFWEDRKWQAQLTREVAYEVFTVKYMFSKKNAPSKNKYWPLDENTPKNMDAQIEAMRRAREQFEKERKEREK